MLKIPSAWARASGFGPSAICFLSVLRDYINLPLTHEGAKEKLTLKNGFWNSERYFSSWTNDEADDEHPSELAHTLPGQRCVRLLSSPFPTPSETSPQGYLFTCGGDEGTWDFLSVLWCYANVCRWIIMFLKCCVLERHTVSICDN